MFDIKRGVSLIVLVITIIIMIILASAIVLNFNNNNPIENASELKIKSDFVAIKEECYEKVNNELVQIYSDISEINGKAEDYSETAKSKYSDKFIIEGGKLKIKGTASPKEQKAAKDLNIDIK